MSVSLSVDGDPGGCKTAADDIRALAGRVDSASDMLARTMTTACGAWSGHSSDAFTEFAKERLHRADDLHDELRLLWLALEAFANGLAEVKSEMKRARAIAVRHDIPVPGDTLPEVGEITLEPGQEGPLDHAVAVANRAREHEQTLQRGWQAMLDRVSGLVWEPIDLGSVGKATSSSGPLDKLKDLAPDLPNIGLPDINLPDIDPSELAANVKDAMPSLPTIGGHKIPLPQLANPTVLLPLMALRAAKRKFPDASDEIDEGIREGTKFALPKLATAGCVAAGAPALVAELGCGGAGKLAAGPLGDELVEMTDAD